MEDHSTTTFGDSNLIDFAASLSSLTDGPDCAAIYRLRGLAVKRRALLQSKWTGWARDEEAGTAAHPRGDGVVRRRSHRSVYRRFSTLLWISSRTTTRDGGF